MKILNELLQYLIKQNNNKIQLSKLITDTFIVKFLISTSVIFMLCTTTTIKAQYVEDYRFSDSVFINSHSPNKATFYSAILPGLGQIYNKKYWKVPLIYAGIGGLIYYTRYNSFVYNKYNNAYNIQVRIDNGETELEPVYPDRPADNLKQTKETWRRYRDLCIIGIGVFYVAQILDANVDANLFYYDMSENLSMTVDPVILPNETLNYNSNFSCALGLRCSIRF